METTRTITVDADRQIRGLWFALGCSVLIALIVVLASINVQSGRVLDREGHGWPFASLFAPFTIPNSLQGWRVVTEPGQLLNPERYPDLYDNLLRAHAIVDFAFIAVYFLLLRTVIDTLTRNRWQTVGRGLLWALVGADVAENLLSLPGWPDVPAIVIVVATEAKWGLVVAILAILLLSSATSGAASDERGVKRRLKRTYKAVTHQRFAFVPVIALFVLSVLSGAAILEQLPDVLRRWSYDGWPGAGQAAVSMVSTLIVSVALVIAGRYRSGYAFRHPEVHPPSPPTKDREDERPYLWVWLVGPGLALLGLVVVLVTGGRADVIKVRFLVFALLPLLVIVLVSIVLRWYWGQHGDQYRFDEPPTFDDRELTAVRLAGNIGGIGVVVVGGLSLIRAYVPLVILSPEDTLARPALVWMYLTIGAASVVVPWAIAMAVVRAERDRRIHRLQDPEAGELWSNLRAQTPRGSWILLAAGVGMFLVLGLGPGLTARMGVAATATLALGCMAVMLSAVALMIQDRPTAEVFRWLGLRRSPLVSMLALTVILVSLFGGQNSIHAVDRGRDPTSETIERDTMDKAFDAWLAAPGCGITLGSRPVRPMLMVAAEGGGIRAAYWTARGLQAIHDDVCAKSATLFSAGASGGSVGLAVARFSGTPEEPHAAGAVQAVKQMADPAILAQATDGTFVRDLLYGATGVPLQRWGAADWREWKDRARLVEDGWADAKGDVSHDWGDRDFLTPNDELSTTTGQLILNSSDVKHACRVWVSQIDPGPPVTTSGEESFDPELSCDKAPGPAARTIDLFSAYGPLVPGVGPGACLGRLRSATAALLTARFPYVTPSAVIEECPPSGLENGKSQPYWPRTQLVDGGYIENSGLATITDLSSSWLREVREHNTEVLADPDSTDPLVVPIVVFLTNGDRAVVQPAIGTSPVSELVVPPVTFLRSGTSLSGNGALLERARTAVDIGGFCPGEHDECTALASRFPSRVVVVDRLTQPEVGAPLGWVMSEASIESMETAVKVQLEAKCVANEPRSGAAYGPVAVDQETQPSCRTGYATLGDLVRYFKPNT